jgi:diacylglycerol kinase family enzyme
MGWGVDYKLDKAITHILSEPEPVEVDVLYCNDRPVFNNVIIGEAFQLVTSKNGVKTGFFSKMRELFKRFSRIKPFAIKAQFKGDKELSTAVTGVVIVQHGKSTLLSRLMLQSSFVNDGMLHAIFVSPRSVSGLMLFAIRSWWEEKKLPPYAGHVKTNKITLTCEEAFELSEDGNSLSAKSLDLEIKRK